MTSFDQAYWEDRWKHRQTGWDIGYPAPAITHFFDGFANKDARILIPGCGNGWEGEYIYNHGFKNTFLIDIAPSAIDNFLNRNPRFPKDHIILGDFFTLNLSFDVMVEQTFFCAIHPSQRPAYAQKAHDILAEKGLLVGLLFDTDFGNDFPPFGGNKQEYLGHFSPHFTIQQMEPCQRSIPPRANRELFIELVKA